MTKFTNRWIEAAWMEINVGLSEDLLEQEDECHLWLSQNLHRRKTSSIMTMLEQILETRSWKAARGFVQDGRCRVCHERDEPIEPLVAGKVFLKRTICELQKTVLMDRETTSRKVLSGLVQEMALQIISFTSPSIIHSLLVTSLTTIRF